jgi:hypothetical protein
VFSALAFYDKQSFFTFQRVGLYCFSLLYLVISEVSRRRIGKVSTRRIGENVLLNDDYLMFFFSR